MSGHPYTKKEERVIIGLAKQGDKDALDILLQEHQWLAGKIVYRRYALCWLGGNYKELISAAHLGMFNAIEKFDFQYNSWFSSHAEYHIRRAIRRYIASCNAKVSIPTHLFWEINYPTKTTDVELVEKAKLFRKNLHLVEDGTLKVIGYNEAQRRCMNVDNHQIKQVDLSFAKEDLVGKLKRLLTKRQYNIIKLYYGLEGETPRTLDKLSKRYHVSKQAIHQTKAKVLKKLHEELVTSMA